MAHEEACGCGCGQDHAHHHAHHHEERRKPVSLGENQKDFLHQLGHHRYLPVARFTRKDSREEGFAATALAPVFLRSAGDTMEMAKEAGAFLQTLENLGLLTLDYDIPLEGYGYEEYRGSALYDYFCATVAEGAQRAEFLGDTPVLELGSMALTPEGEAIAAAHCGHTHHHH